MLTRWHYAGQLPAGFFELPQRLYAGQPYYPQAEHQAEQLCQQMAATHDLVGYADAPNTLRLLGIFPPDAAEGTAYFGFWETEDDLAVNQLAFNQLRQDAAARGFGRVRGPLHFSTYFRYRLRLGAVPSWGQFDREPVNPPAYPRLLAGVGFRPALTFESRRLQAATVPAVYRQQAAVLAQLADAPFDFIPLNARAWGGAASRDFRPHSAGFQSEPRLPRREPGAVRPAL